MSEFRGTPGEWEWRRTSIPGSNITNEYMTHVRLGVGHLRVLAADSVTVEDAALIKAAPKLLAACQAWDEGFTDGEQFTPEQFRVWVNERRRLAREAIAAALTVPEV